jgi:hypothetical protein
MGVMAPAAQSGPSAWLVLPHDRVPGRRAAPVTSLAVTLAVTLACDKAQKEGCAASKGGLEAAVSY